jgi:Tfp pilus assembly protein PilO
VDFLYDIRTNKQKLAAVAIAFVAFCYIDFSFVLKAQFKSLSQSQSKIVKLQADIQAVKKDIALIQQDQNKGKALSSIKKIVSEGELLSLLEWISVVAKDNLIRVTQINPLKSARAPVKAGQKQSPYIGVLIKLDISCGYHNLGAFINDLENGEYALSAEEIRINSDPSAGQKESVLLTLKTYVKN